jgi:putative ABC transport system permease protein
MILETILLAQREIRRNVMRSSLTILGIVIGVAAVIIMVTLGQGATQKVTSNIESMGSNMLQIRPGQGFGRPGGARMSAAPFEDADVKAIEKEIFGLEAIAPSSTKFAQAIYGNLNWSTTITGSTNAYLEVQDWELESGRPFLESEIRAGKPVCILGDSVRKELFGGQDPVGSTVRVGKVSFKVIGLLKAKGQSNFGRDEDDFVLIPMRTFQRRIAGNTDVSSIYVSAKDGVSTDKMKKDIERLMRERRKIPYGKDDDFNVQDMEEIVSMVQDVYGILTALLGAVAGVSLLVGGIGIMNIMLVSVTERTREIGTRLAIGALERDVLTQFLVEAMVLTSFGGLFGIALGLSAAAVIGNALGLPFVFKIEIVAVAFVFSAGVGMVFGYFPARKAARLNPIEALRHE